MYHNISGSLETFKAMTLPKKVKNLQTVQPRRRSSISSCLSLQNIPSSIRHFSKSHRHPNMENERSWPVSNAASGCVMLERLVESSGFSKLNPEAQDVFQWRWTLILCFILTHVLDPFVENPSVQIYFTDPETRCVRFLIFVLFEFQSNFNSRSRSRSGY